MSVVRQCYIVDRVLMADLFFPFSVLSATCSQCMADGQNDFPNNQQREFLAFNRQGTQQQRSESPTVSPPGMRVNTGYRNSTQGTSSKKDAPQWHIYPPSRAHLTTEVCIMLCRLAECTWSWKRVFRCDPMLCMLAVYKQISLRCDLVMQVNDLI